MVNFNLIADKFMVYFYNFLNGFLMMRIVPQMWYVIKMSIFVFVTVAITFTIAILIENQAHQFYFPFFDQGTLFVTFTSWTVISIGSYIMVGIMAFYGFRLLTYFVQKRKNKL